MIIKECSVLEQGGGNERADDTKERKRKCRKLASAIREDKQCKRAKGYHPSILSSILGQCGLGRTSCAEAREEAIAVVRASAACTGTERPGGRDRACDITRIGIKMLIPCPRGLTLRTMVVMMVMVVLDSTRPAYGMTTVTASPHVLQAFITLV